MPDPSRATAPPQHSLKMSFGLPPTEKFFVHADVPEDADTFVSAPSIEPGVGPFWPVMNRDEPSTLTCEREELEGAGGRAKRAQKEQKRRRSSAASLVAAAASSFYAR